MRNDSYIYEKDKFEEISAPVKKKDHDDKLSGKSIFVADYPDSGVLVGKLLRSTYAKAKIISVDIPPLKEGYYYVDASDIPGDNNVNIVKDDSPVYARETVEYIGEPIAMVCGPDESEVDKILKAIKVNYEPLEPVLDIRKSSENHFVYEYGRGDMQQAFAECDRIWEEEFETGYQEQAYLETQGIMAEIEPNGRVYVHGSMQCPYYVLNAVKRVLACGDDGVHIYQDVTGGAFGGKEAWPSILSCQVAVAAVKCKKSVRCVFERREDMEFTSKRHPSLTHYKVGIKDGKIHAMDVDVIFNGGAYTTLSAVVIQRGLICAAGIYKVPNLHVTGRAVKTNTTPCGAYRGFGAPQTCFAVEMIMNHIAQDLGVTPLEFKLANASVQGDLTSTSGKYHFPIPVPDMVEELDKLCNFRQKYIDYSKPQYGRYRRGIGLSMYFHGAGFTGSAERTTIKAKVKLKKYKDGTVEILASNTEMGQGLRTTFPKIAARELGIPLEKVFYNHPDTARVPNSGPTAASRSLMVVGELVRRASIKLKEQWKDGEEIEVEDNYVEPDFMIPFDLDKFYGDAYATYAWGVNAIEVEVDTYTGLVKILGAYGNFDVGTPVDYNIIIGQMEGGFLQGIGYASIEKMNYDNKGRIRNNSFSDYLIPTSKDVENLKCILHVEKFPNGPYGAKGAGELPLVGAPPAYLQAVEQALGEGRRLNYIPFSSEDVVKELYGEKR